MGKIHHYIGALTGALALSACIPATTAPAPRAPSVAHKAPASDFERGSLGEVVGGDARPTWTLQPVAANARDIAASTYIVRPGDTLRAIGAMTGAGSEAIAMENDLAPPYTLRPGQQLRIPAGRYHRVAAGETGIGIAHAYGVDWGEVVTINALAEPYILIDDIMTGSQPALAASTRPAAASAAPRAPVTTAIAPPAAFSGRFQWPLQGKLIARFGPLAPGKVNDGINIAAARGTPIHAAAAGVVAYAGDQIAVYGGLILIDHGGGWMSAYGHAAKIDVQRGQAVKTGEVIGLAGATGQVQSPQLHFQLRKNRIPVDPMKQLPPR